VIVTRRMDYPLRRGRWVDLLYNRSVAVVVAISLDVRQKLLAAGVAPQRIRVIHSAVEPPAGLPGPAGRAAARARYGIGVEEVAIGMVAALERRKAHDVLLQALAPAVATMPPFRVLFCGDGSERRPLERMARALGLGDRVRFLGEQRQVADVLAALDLFVLPSRQEGLGVAVLEAMAMALPVVATAVGGLPEAVEAGRTGLLVPPEDPRALGAAIAELARDLDRARRMGDAGRARVAAEFSMERMSEAYEKLYAETAAAAAGNRSAAGFR
jgi:glycosyltransferase involved in cell wall biosynthesis